ncbi:MAG: hypothetical protein ACP5O0_07680 [Acidimicrobiales bacterium]
MSTLWTPDGEHTPRPSTESDAARTQKEERAEPTDAELEELRRTLAQTEPSEIIANHCFGLFELAAIHLSQTPPQLAQATLAIDALSAIVERCQGRLGLHENELKDALHQLQLAFVQVSVLEPSSASSNDRSDK